MMNAILSAQLKIATATSGSVYGLRTQKQTHSSMQPVHMCLVRSHLFHVYSLHANIRSCNTNFLPAPPVLGVSIEAFNYVTNRMSNMTTATGIAREVHTTGKTLNHVPIKHNWKTLPMQMLVVLALVAAVSTAVIYPSRSHTHPLPKRWTELRHDQRTRRNQM